ncbi:MAG: 3-isopropylmalate dehydratase [Thermoplasmatota archaeon]
MIFEGRLRIISDSDGRTLDDIDTDQIYHNRHLAVTDIDEMGQYTFGNLEGYEDFPETVREGDIILVGENFGSGSSRQQAVDCFISLKVKAVLARSIGAIYKRNAINMAFPIFVVEDIKLGPGQGDDNVREGDVIRFDTETGEITRRGSRVGRISIPSRVQMEIMAAGGLFKYGKNL